MEATDHILIVDDDREIRTLTTDYLQRQCLRVSAANGGDEMRAVLALGKVDLVVLDVRMPGEDGLTLGRDLRQRFPHMPILMLSSLSEDTDRIVGLELGADDYMTKPFSPRELLARIRAILRRSRSIPPQAQDEQRQRFCLFGDWKLDKVERCLIGKDGTVSELPSAEYNLLALFVSNPGKPMTRDQLMNQLMGANSSFVDRSIDLRVSRLRTRLADGIEYIKTIRHEGYVFSRSVTHSA